MRVFLGGTCNESKWRNIMMVHLNEYGIDYFNPVVDDWTPECQKIEIKERENCDYCLYCITPQMTGVYSIAEAVDDSNKKPEKTIFIALRDDCGKFTESQWKSISMVAYMIRKNGGLIFDNLKSAAIYLNEVKK